MGGRAASSRRSRALGVADVVGAVFDALADGNRRALIGFLAERETATSTELAAELPLTRQGVAKHLEALREAGLVRRRRRGRETRYRLTPEPMTEAVSWIAAVGAQWDERLAALAAHLAARPKRVTRGRGEAGAARTRTTQRARP